MSWIESRPAWPEGFPHSLPGMKADSIFPKFHPSSSALVKKHLPQNLFSELKNSKTSSGFTLEKAIKSGVVNKDSSIGIYAGDKESYDTFAQVFDPIIEEYHNLKPDHFHQPDITKINLPPVDPEKLYIRSTRIRVARNIDPLPFSCNMNKEDRIMVEQKVKTATDALPDDLAGEYISFAQLPETVFKARLIKHEVFPKGDRFQDAAGMNSDYPLGRGIFLSRDKRFRIWVNEEDHLRVMALNYDSDISGVFNRLVSGLNALEHHMDFTFDPKKGFLSACPTNIGTSMRAGVHICLKKLEQRPTLLEDLVKKHHLQIRGTGGEKTAVDNAVFDISNARRLGISTNTIIQDLHAGLSAIIHTEKNL